MLTIMRINDLLGLILIAFLLSATPAAGQLEKYPSRYYILYSDLDEQDVREAELRISRVAEEYDRITSPLGGTINKRLPFYLFRHKDDYLAAGGLPNSVGVFTGDKLMAVAGEKINDHTWKTIQHEGFHQFVRVRLPRDIPVWINEGMAEYFEEAVFTGDRIVTGMIPQARLQRIRTRIRAERFKTIPQMMQLGRKAWNHQMTSENYDQAWSMVYFLAHGDNLSYQTRLNGFLIDMGRRGVSWERAWLAHFGPVNGSFEAAWKRYWLDLPENPSRIGYAEANVVTMTNFLARAHAQKQKFSDAREFFGAAQSGDLRMNAGDWLPPYLLTAGVHGAGDIGKWKLFDRPRTSPTLSLTLDDGTTITGAFSLQEGRVRSVWVETTSIQPRTRRP